MQKNLFDENYNILNDEQKEAVETIYGPVMVVAGPGTGKTQIIGLRTANILLKTDINPENIFITTFTEAGVIAIRERLLSFIGEDAYKVNVSTIHSFASDVIKTFPERFIEYKTGTTVDDVEILEILKEILDKLIKDKKVVELTSDYDTYYYLRDIKSAISNLKQEGVNSQKLEELIKHQEEVYKEELAEIKPTLKKYENTKNKQEKHIVKLVELNNVFIEYNKYLRKNHKYDFNDMINFVLEKFRVDEDLVYHYAEKFQFIMLDEYQDTNNAQNEIISLILNSGLDKERPNILVVGDDDQSIYRFQGANIENMLDFSTDYKETNFVVLKHNYRSTQNILDISSKLIDNNEERLSKKIDIVNKELTSSGKYKSEKISPKLFRAASDIEEKAFILKQVNEKLSSGINKEEIAIIVRNNREVEEYSRLLEQNGIDVESKQKTDILKSSYIEFLLKYLRVINNPYEKENDLIDIMRSNILGLDQTDIFKINRYLYIKNYSKKFKLTMMDILLDIENNTDVPELSEIQKILDFRDNLISLGNISKEVNFVNFFNEVVNNSGIIDFIDAHGSFDDSEDIFTLFNKIKNWTSIDKELNIDKLLIKLELYKSYNYPINRQILSKPKGGVQVLTAHSSKGLEYEVVFIPGLYNGNWEGKRIINKLKLPVGMVGEGLQESKNIQIEEDRRLFFVALTRAKKELYLTYPAGVGTKPLLQSIFIEEIKDYLEDLEIKNILDNSDIEELVENELKNNIITYNNAEFDYIEEFLDSYKLSPSDLNTFLSDPKEFLHRVVFKYPFIDNEFTIFGKVYHRTLELFYLKYKKEGKLPEKSYLTSTFSMLLEKEILTPDEYKKLKEKGVEGLSGYYDLHESNIKEPLLLEYSFRRKNIVFAGVPLTGTIDKIEKIGEIAGDTDSEGQLAFFKDSVALIDYKTGKPKTLGMIKGIDRYGNKKPGEGNYARQLMFYRLLCELDSEFTSKFNIGSVALDFVEGRDGIYKLVDVDISDEEYEEFKEELKDAWSKINNISFWKELLLK